MSATYIVVDLGFGDAGKGTLVDALARRCSTPPLVVRFNGGAQAGHNVHTPDGRHHTFSQFGSGTFVPGCRTLLSRYMILHPPALLAEHEHLVSLGVKDALQRLMVHSRALVVTPYQQAANRLREAARGAGRHGTCGLGIGETVADMLDRPDMALRAGDLHDGWALRRKLEFARETKREQMASLLPALHGLGAEAAASVATIEDGSKLDEFARLYTHVGEQLRIIDEEDARFQVRESENVVFEGAQGVLLDEWRGFHPHTTWSTTTTENALRLIAESGRSGMQRSIGVVRAYATRHGEGPFPTESERLRSVLRDQHNVDTGWQGQFRVGWFDALLTRYALRQCPDVTDIAVTCLDRMKAIEEPWHICDGYIVAEEDREFFKMKSKGTRASDVGKAVSLGPNGDLAYQERLTRALFRVATRLLSGGRSDEQYVQAIERQLERPVNITSFGPTADDKRWLWSW